MSDILETNEIKTDKIKSEEKVIIFIDNKKVTASGGSTLLRAANASGIHIPTLCYNEKIKPHGACRLCLVEIEKREKRRIVASCAYPAEEGLKVFTESPRVEEIRKNLVELY